MSYAPRYLYLSNVRVHVHASMYMSLCNVHNPESSSFQGWVHAPSFDHGVGDPKENDIFVSSLYVSLAGYAKSLFTLMSSWYLLRKSVQFSEYKPENKNMLMIRKIENLYLVFGKSRKIKKTSNENEQKELRGSLQIGNYVTTCKKLHAILVYHCYYSFVNATISWLTFISCLVFYPSLTKQTSFIGVDSFL